MKKNTSDLYTINTDGCWIWNGTTKGHGYGKKRFYRKTIAAHRYIYEIHRGPIPNGLQLDHLCRVRACVNPDHLEPVTLTENLRRGARTKLTVRDVVEIRGLLKTSMLQVDIARKFGVHPQSITSIKLGYCWVSVC